VLQDGKLWGEVFHAPRVPYNIHSTAKTFTSTAVGFAVDEGLLSLDDKVVDAFPELMPDRIDDRLGALNLRHLLTMSSGHGEAEIPGVGGVINLNHIHYSRTDWLRQFFAKPIECEPGVRFRYESCNTYTAGAMLQKKAGMTTVEYLKSRLFEPLGIETPYWKESPEGYNIGYTGLWLRTEDMVKWAELFRNKGNWHGRQLLSPEWVADATSYHIAVDPENPSEDNAAQGYGYQIWLAKHGYYGGGLGGQFMIAVPHCKASIGFSCYDIEKNYNAFELIWDMLVPALE